MKRDGLFIETALTVFLKRINILATRIEIETPGFYATVPILRGVWGAALHKMNSDVYFKVFAGKNNSNGESLPCYVLRPAMPGKNGSPALEQILIGPGCDHFRPLMAAWSEACRMGLGSNRSPFVIRSVRSIGPFGTSSPPEAAPHRWSLDTAAWPLAGNAATTPCRLSFIAPLRILRGKTLVESPGLADIVSSSARRVAQYLPETARLIFKELKPGLMAEARQVPMNSGRWERLDLVRYSGSQKRELDLFGVTGHLDLPEGPGGLWPLLAATCWLHAGKATIFGLGHLRVEKTD